MNVLLYLPHRNITVADFFVRSTMCIAYVLKLYYCPILSEAFLKRGWRTDSVPLILAEKIT